MRFFGETNIDFIGKRKVAYMISVAAIVIGFIMMLAVNKGLQYSIDFKGGLVLELDLNSEAQTIEVEDLRSKLKKNGINDFTIQSVEAGENTYYLVNTAVSESGKVGENQGDKIIKAIRKEYKHLADKNIIRKQEEVGPSIGAELKGKAFNAAIFSLIGIVIYITFRFAGWFGIAAVVALIHDVLISLCLISVLGIEISIPVVAAILTIVGYSLNDTIVVFDRIREDLKFMGRLSYDQIINKSINETLSRTIITSLTTFLAVLFILVFGGAGLRDFATTLMCGVIVGTYSSIFIASPILVEHFNRKTANVLRKK